MKYQKEIKKNDYDVIIIGSGVAGLVTAAHFVSEGLSVLVLEQHLLQVVPQLCLNVKILYLKQAGIDFQE